MTIAKNETDTLALEEIKDSIKRWSGNPDRDYDWEPCVLCGRPVRMDRPAFMICMIDGGSKLIAFDAVTAEMEERNDFVGCHPVGPSCRKRLPKRFVQR